jgi:hypothetical protein
MAFRERVMEDRRLSNFPSKPSRLSSVFGCRDLGDALQYHMSHARWSIVYRVETVTDEHRVHHAPWLFDYEGPRAFYFDGTQGMADIYWQEHPLTRDMETLVDCPVRILERIHVSGG